METFSTLLAFCVLVVIGESTAQRPVTQQSFDVFFHLQAEQTIARLVIWDTIVLIMTSL